MLYRNSIILTLGLLLIIVACKDSYHDKIDPSRVDYVNNDNKQPPTELDAWLNNQFTIPYNIEVKYRWDASELNLFRTLVPPAPEKVQPVMDVVKKVWIDTYAALAGEDFIKKYCPKQFVLVGSASYNFDGTITLGTAEGGRKVVLYVVNDFVKTEPFAVKQMMHTIEHEFGHILHQNVSYNAQFKEITSAGYTASWNTVPLSQARAQGFITSYAMASPDEDFVEMIAMMLVEGKKGYEAILECQTSAAGKELLRRKEQLVVEYFQEAYQIDFYQLQTKVQEAIEQIAPGDDDGEEPPPVFDEWGYGKAFSAIRFDLSVLAEPSDFVARYNYDNARLHTEGYALDYTFKLFFTAEDEVILRLYYYTLAGEVREYKEANFKFILQKLANGAIVFLYSEADENGMYLEETLQARGLLSYFANYNFRVDWKSICSGERYVGLYPVKAPEKYCFGILNN